MTAREYCVRMPSCSRLGLVEHHVALRVETVGSGEPGNAGADDGDLHLRRDAPRRSQFLPTPGLSTAARHPTAGHAATKETR